MSTTVTYKGSTLTTVNNETKSLLTKGTWLEDDIEITDVSSGGSGTALIVDTTDSHGGIIREITTDAEVRLEGSKTVTPTSSQQTITPSQGYDGFSSVIVNAMPSGTAGTPTATKGAVSNHSVSVTPSVTNTTGYITGGTKNGTAITVSASELVSGTKTITENGTGIDVVNYASVDVNVASETKPTLTITGSGHSTNTYITYNNTKYYNPTSFTFNSGDSISFHLRGGGDDVWEAIVTINGASLCYQEAAYDGSFVLPNADVTVSLGYDTSYYRNTISITYSLPGSSYTPISVGTLEITANQTSTSAVNLETLYINVSSLSLGDQLYIKIRDKAGKRAGYFYGTDIYFIWGNTTNHAYPSTRTYRYGTDEVLRSYTTGTTTGYGIYPSSVGTEGEMVIRARYNSTYSYTIDGTYSIDVYKLKWPEDISPFN